ncbi:MAG: adenylosuccinate lyase [Gammaproteobacteria bacterium]|nr:adenylosuccinate lyase [Gammaproteobacteria bacterium]
MELNQLSALSPLDGRYYNKSQALADCMSEYGLIRFRLSVEIHWLIKLCQTDGITKTSSLNKKQQQQLLQLLDDFDLDEAKQIKMIEQATNHDVKAVEYYLQEQLNRLNLEQLIPFVHFGCTSEDINNVAYSLMLQQASKKVLLPAMLTLIRQLNTMAKDTAKLSMLARTHGQPATPTTLGKELKNFNMRLERQYLQLKQFSLSAKFNGAVGNFNAHRIAYPDIDWPTLSESFIHELGLTPNLFTAQIEPHDNLVEFLQIISRFNTILIDLNRDIWSYISLGFFQQQRVKGEVGSSTMPHKINPIDFENSEGNLGIANSLIMHFSNKLPISRWQRDLTDSTVLRNLGIVFGYSYIAYQSHHKGLQKLIANETVIEKELASHWEVLAEALQTVMRRHGIADAYEQLKELTRGEAITETRIKEFIKTLNIPAADKKTLLALTPNNYLGFAIELTNKDVNNGND